MQTSTKTSERLLWVDISKGITIILMVIGHANLPIYARNLIWAFHMPLFFILSGFTTKWSELSFRTLLQKRIKSLLVPFLGYSIIDFIIYYFYLDGPDLITILQDGWDLALWFIPVLFLSNCLAYTLKKVSNLRLQILVSFVISLLTPLMSYFHVDVPWSLAVVPYASLFVVLGSNMNCVKQLYSSRSILLPIVYLIIIMTEACFFRFDMATNKTVPFVVLTIGALAGSLMIFNVSTRFSSESLVSRILSSVGRETFVIIAFSQILIMLANRYLSIGSILKYLLLVVALFSICKLKNFIVRRLFC